MEVHETERSVETLRQDFHFHFHALVGIRFRVHSLRESPITALH